MSHIESLMTWYQAQCDGDWEHQYGVRITTLDNPGWSLDVDLAETQQSGKLLPKKMIERSENDWIFVEVKEECFRARGGSGNLQEMLGLFVEFLKDDSLPQGS